MSLAQRKSLPKIWFSHNELAISRNANINLMLHLQFTPRVFFIYRMVLLNIKISGAPRRPIPLVYHPWMAFSIRPQT